MKTELTINEVKEAFSAFSSVQGNVPIDLSWAIDDIKEVLTKHAKRANDEQNKLLELYGELKSKIGDRVRYNIPIEKRAAYTEDVKALGELKVEIEFSPLDYEVVDEQGIRFDPNFSKILRKFIIKQQLPKETEKEKEMKPKVKKKPTIEAAKEEPSEVVPEGKVE